MRAAGAVVAGAASALGIHLLFAHSVLHQWAFWLWLPAGLVGGAVVAFVMRTGRNLWTPVCAAALAAVAWQYVPLTLAYPVTTYEWVRAVGGLCFDSYWAVVGAAGGSLIVAKLRARGARR